MAESATHNSSKALFSYMCQNIVGTEEHVKTIRMMNNVRDNIQSNVDWTTITSGSFGEGLELKGSDLDIMFVVNLMEVHENININSNPETTKVIMATEDTQPGFTQLKLVYSNDLAILKFCDAIGEHFFVSNTLFKQTFAGEHFSAFDIHGPCLSDRDEFFDLAFCVRSKAWVTQAKQWLTRSHNEWPGCALKHAVTKHGVLFVPVGVKGSIKENLEWRMSFSVGEKLLIYTFAHTQFLCYALLKILLKDVIEVDLNCKDLLCSYFLKTIMFWVSEELPTYIWKPENLIYCFVRCFRRLVYCVENSICPHYFIPEYNLFENKIKGHAQEVLLQKLSILNSYGWRCIEFSDRISSFKQIASHIHNFSSTLRVDSCKQLLSSTMIIADTYSWSSNFTLVNGTYKLLSLNTSKIKYLYLYYMSKMCNAAKKILPLKGLSSNKSYYKQYKNNIIILLQNIHHDAVSGWLLLASFFYGMKQYILALRIIQYSLSKCTPNKLFQYMDLTHINFELFNLHLFQKTTVVRLWKYFLLESVIFRIEDTLIPYELKFKGEFPAYVFHPAVYAKYLCFLCHFHLKNKRECFESLRDLQLTIEECSSIKGSFDIALSYNILAKAFLLVGNKESSRQAFKRAIKLISEPVCNPALRKFYH